MITNLKLGNYLPNCFFYFLQNLNQTKWKATLDTWVSILMNSYAINDLHVYIYSKKNNK